MVEGHSVHRVAASHTKRLCGKVFKATSPNGRFTDGAKAISGRKFARIEAVGKNLFAFFAAAGHPDVVVHVHFGMSGRWSVADASSAKPVTATTRLQLEGHGLVSHLSAMTVAHGDQAFYEGKVKALGCAPRSSLRQPPPTTLHPQPSTTAAASAAVVGRCRCDPLRADADPEELWRRVSGSAKTIGLLLMDQSFFAGVGNIYRCEILFVAAVHPEVKGRDLSRDEFERVWRASVALMGRGFQSGSILTVDPAEALALGSPGLRRYIYNSPHCGRCRTKVQAWEVAGRTCYACPSCQPKDRRVGAAPEAAAPQLFNSHCAAESLEASNLRRSPRDLV